VCFVLVVRIFASSLLSFECRSRLEGIQSSLNCPASRMPRIGFGSYVVFEMSKVSRPAEIFGSTVL
jgi:hypothetical protein